MNSNVSFRTVMLIALSMFLFGCVDQTEPFNLDQIPPEKYCEQDSDCLTSCGTEVGRGECFNRDYILGTRNDSDILGAGGVCCGCDDEQPCFSCQCINNRCEGLQEHGNYC